MHWKHILASLLTLVALAIIGFILVLAVHPTPLEIDATHDDAHVYFASDRAWLPYSNACTTVHWSAEHIDRIYYNDIGTVGVGDKEVCIQIKADRPSLRVVFTDGTSETYTLPVRVMLHDGRIWLAELLAAVLLVAALVLASPNKAQAWWHANVAAWRARRLHPDLSVGELAFSRWMAYAFSAINISFALAAAWTIPHEQLWPGGAFVLLAAALAIVAWRPAFWRWGTQIMRPRGMVFAPVAWFILSVVIVDYGMAHLQRRELWSGVQVWAALLFFWLAVYWLGLYALRMVHFTPARRFAWITLGATALLVSLMSVFVPFTQTPTASYNAIVESEPVGVMHYSLAMSGDAYDYARYTQAFPYVWRSIGQVIHRPAFFMVTSQVCQVIDVPVAGYITGNFGCSSLDLAIFSTWLTNAWIALLNALIMYELVTAVLHNRRIGWLAAMLIVLSPFTLWFVPDASTDYAETLISAVSLWVLYRVFSVPHVSNRQIVVYGGLLGILLLVKLNPTYLIFGCLVALVMRRWRLLPMLTVMPLVVAVAYMQLIPLLGIRYMMVETGSQWRTVNWLWQGFIYDTPYGMARAIARWFGNTADKTALFFGFLLLVGMTVMIVDRHYPRWLLLMAWGMFVTTAGFAFVFQFSYVSHVIGLVPFVYGAVALGVERARIYLAWRYSHRPLLQRALYLAVLALPVVHNVIMWVAWTTPFRINNS